MADAIVKCKTCGIPTEHMHLAGKVCICSICGESNQVKNWKQIQADVEERKKGHQAAVAKAMGKIEEAGAVKKRLSEAEILEIRKQYVELTAGGKSRWDAWVTLSADYGVSETSIRSKVRDLDETNPTPAEPIAAQTETAPAAIETKEPKGENTMKKLTEENIADIKRRKAAGEKPAALAEEFGVNCCSIYAVLSKGGTKKAKKATGTKKGNGAIPAPAGDVPEPAPTLSAGNPFKDAIAVAVSGHLSDLDRRIDAKVREILAEMLK